MYGWARMLARIYGCTFVSEHDLLQRSMFQRLLPHLAMQRYEAI